MSYKVTLIPGDGIGPEVTQAAKKCLEATGIKFEWEEAIAGTNAIKEYGTPLPGCVLKSIRKNKIALKGPIITPIGRGFRSVNVALRQELNLFACLRPVKSIPGIKSPYSGIDLVIVRENSEDLYAGIEFEKGKENTRKLLGLLQRLQSKKLKTDCAISIKPISAGATRKIVRFAFEYARKYKRKKVTAVHKANIMKFTDGLFLETARRAARKYSGKIIFDDCLVDNLAMQLVRNPHNFDVLVLPNLYGDIISDLCAGLVGGLGIAAGANIGKNIALFEAVHGAAPKYAGLNKVNPTAMILSGVLMLEYLGEVRAAKK
ncbi:MAG: isocitrate dehydrogenase, partial [Omnitrophica WOR_2 bacterium RIFCSPLOWO2_12_FULL_46_30]